MQAILPFSQSVLPKRRQYLSDLNLHIDDKMAFIQIAEYWNISIDQLIAFVNQKNYDLQTRIEEFLKACEYDYKKTACCVCGELNTLFDATGYYFNYFDANKIKQNHWATIRNMDGQMYVAYCKKCERLINDS